MQGFIRVRLGPDKAKIEKVALCVQESWVEGWIKLGLGHGWSHARIQWSSDQFMKNEQIAVPVGIKCVPNLGRKVDVGSDKDNIVYIGFI